MTIKELYKFKNKISKHINCSIKKRILLITYLFIFKCYLNLSIFIFGLTLYTIFLSIFNLGIITEITFFIAYCYLFITLRFFSSIFFKSQKNKIYSSINNILTKQIEIGLSQEDIILLQYLNGSCYFITQEESEIYALRDKLLTYEKEIKNKILALKINDF